MNLLQLQKERVSNFITFGHHSKTFYFEKSVNRNKLKPIRVNHFKSI